jgi:mono/diheme cytochrome c family protein
MRTLPIVFLVAACGGASSSSSSESTTPELEPAAATAEAQIARGGELYGQHCAKCHGGGGEGSDRAPAVVGGEALPRAPREGAKRDVEFHTAGDVYEWVKVHMPGGAPGTLSDDEYLAILAFDLSANGVTLTEPLTAEAAAAMVIRP